MRKIIIALLLNALLMLSLCLNVQADDPPFLPIEDAFVDLNEAGVPHNEITLPVDVSVLFTDIKPTRNSYLKFNVSALASPIGITSKIRLFTYVNSYTGFNISIWSTSDAWSESTITWNNAPVAITELDTQIAPTSTGVWVEFTGAALAGYINSERSGDGIASFVVTFDSCTNCGPDSVAFYDVEYGPEGFRPYLDPEIPTGFDVAGFSATPSMDSIQVQWNTGNETDLRGFNLHRSLTEVGAREILNPTLIEAKYSGTILGALYTFDDNDLQGGTTYYYWLEMVGFSDSSFLKDPVIAAANYLVYLPVTQKGNTPLRSSSWWIFR